MDTKKISSVRPIHIGKIFIIPDDINDTHPTLFWHGNKVLEVTENGFKPLGVEEVKGRWFKIFEVGNKYIKCIDHKSSDRSKIYLIPISVIEASDRKNF